MEFNKHKHPNNERYLSQGQKQQQQAGPVSGKRRTKGGQETFVELIRVKRLPDGSGSRSYLCIHILLNDS